MLSEAAKQAFINRTMAYISDEMNVLCTTRAERAELAKILLTKITDKYLTDTAPKLNLRLRITDLSVVGAAYRSKDQGDTPKPPFEYQRVPELRPEIITPPAQSVRPLPSGSGRTSFVFDEALRPPPPGKGHNAPSRQHEVGDDDLKHRYPFRLGRTRGI